MAVKLNARGRAICNGCGFPIGPGKPAALVTDLDDPDDTAAWIYHEECAPSEAER